MYEIREAFSPTRCREALILPIREAGGEKKCHKGGGRCTPCVPSLFVGIWKIHGIIFAIAFAFGDDTFHLCFTFHVFATILLLM